MSILHTSYESKVIADPVGSWFLAISVGLLITLLIIMAYTNPSDFASTSTDCQKQACIVTVNYKSALSEYIASGKYQWINPAFTDEHFGADTSTEIRNVPIQVIALPNIPIREAVNELTKRNYRPATSRELLAMIASGVLENFHGTLVAPGTLWKVPMGHVAVPAFENIKGFKTMEVFGAGVLGWRDNIFFAAVPLQ